jgi:Mce-associated membrane protein
MVDLEDVEGSGTGAEPVEDLQTDPGSVDSDSAEDAEVDSVESDPAEVRSRPVVLAILALSVVIVLGALAFGGVAAWRLHTAHGREDRDAAILSTTRHVVADLVTLRHDSAADDMKRVADSTVGKFHDQFADTSSAFSSVLQQGQVVSTGEAKEVALVDADDHKATTLAAVVSTVKNTEAPDGQQRVYRMKVSLESVGGRWLVSNVEFVS